MLKYVNLASHDAKTMALAEKLETMADGLYCPPDVDEWDEILTSIKSLLIQADKVKLLGLFKKALRRWRNKPYFNVFRV